MTLCACGCGVPVRNLFVRGHAGGVARKTHGMRGTPEFHAYYDAKQRCTNPKATKWSSYGGRGIKFLFESFEEFFAEIGLRPSSEYSLDRENNDGHYAPGNVRWATVEQQMATRRLSGAALASNHGP